MAIILNEEQQACIAAAANTKDNLLVEALAGAAKTTTLVEMAKTLSGSALSIAFNKKIADEMAERMPRGVECRTLNSLGHRILGKNISRKLQLADDKIMQLLKNEVSRHHGEEQELLSENFMDLLALCNGSKNHGHVPDSLREELGRKCTPILTDEDFWELTPEDYPPIIRDVVGAVVDKSFRQALNGRIDYADQLLLPTVLKMVFPVYQNVLADEVQDFSELNHRMVEKLVKGRIIAVGDSRQAIYAFRGAHTHGMPILAKRFNMTTLHLSTTFRCPSAICDYVRPHVPRIEAWADNPRNPGEIRSLDLWKIEDIPVGAAVICRNNAPLFRLAVRMLKGGRYPKLWGNDVAAALIKVMEGFGPGSMTQASAMTALASYQADKEKKLKRDSAKAALQDRVDCIRIFLEQAPNLAGAIMAARQVINASGRTDLCTGHKAKGNEWEEVFFLDHHLLSDEEQDMNLEYVIATRSQKNLTFISTDGYFEE